jgi:putative membrane-bound dehydrogenase-like protein
MPRVCRLFSILAILSFALGLEPLSAEEPALQVPDGFDVSLYADDALAHDIFSMTIDAQGRVVVAGAGYVKILHDTDSDGRADRATLFSTLPESGAHGMVFDGPDLICSGDNAVMRLTDRDGDGVADGAPQLWTALRHPEHGANGLVHGPDGCYYLVCGNDAGVSEKQITAAASAVAHPHSGAIVRFSAAGRPLDVVAHGFRNPYDLDFDAAGHLLTVDSDGERDHHLPWYAPNRLFDVAPGMEHGWLLSGWTRGWNRPAAFFDSVDRMVEIGRGSPTGLVVYRHRAFPSHYRGGVFTACWTFGRVYYCPLVPAGATCASKFEVFMQTSGDVGFAPCDLAVGPQGDLFVAIGGRRTRGSVFRVHYRGGEGQTEQPVAEIAAESPLARVLEADQPLSSWSRARWVPLARQMGKAPFVAAIMDGSVAVESRIRAVEILVESFDADLFDGLSANQIEQGLQSAPAPVRARVAWALGRGTMTPEVLERLARMTDDVDPCVERAAWESLMLAAELDPQLPVQPAWSRGLSSRERRVRSAAIAVARSGGRASFGKFRSSVPSETMGAELRLACLRIELPESPAAGAADIPALSERDVTTCLRSFAESADNSDLRIEAVRLLQIALGDVRVAPGLAEVYSGYVANGETKLDSELARSIVNALAPKFPNPNAELSRELARLMGMLRADHAGLTLAVARMWTPQSPVEDDLHYLIVASLLRGSRSSEVTAATAECLLNLHAKLDARGQFPSRNWPLRVGEVFDELCLRDPGLDAAIVGRPRFGHAGHALFVERLRPALRPRATRQLWLAVVGRNERPSSELVALVGRLPEQESLPLLRSQWEEAELRDAIVLALSRHPREVDRSKLVEGLSSPQPSVVAKAAQALVPLGINCSSAEMAQALRALKRACAVPRDTEPRKSLLALLNFWTEENSDVDVDPDPTKAYVGWFELFDQYYPAEAAGLKTSAGLDAAGWKRRLASVDWSAGDAARGRVLYERQACHRCHQVGGHLGPELKGAISRLSREDLFTAIIDPNLEVSPAFQTTVVATDSGQVYHGLVVYESPEGILLQTGPDTTVRVTDVEKSSMRASTRSLMPTGLLDAFSDGDLSDLYAHLKTLAAP